VTRDERSAVAPQVSQAEMSAGENDGRAISTTLIGEASRSPPVEGPHTRQETGSSSTTVGTGVTSKRKQATADKARERAAWESAHPKVNLTAERQRYESEIRPRLASATFSIRDLAAALGLSVSHSARIRAGEVVPHPRHYSTIEALLRPPSSGKE
jgi:hypothetical protein